MTKYTFALSLLNELDALCTIVQASNTDQTTLLKVALQINKITGDLLLPYIKENDNGKTQ